MCVYTRACYIPIWESENPYFKNQDVFIPPSPRLETSCFSNFSCFPGISPVVRRLINVFLEGCHGRTKKANTFREFVVYDTEQAQKAAILRDVSCTLKTFTSQKICWVFE